MFAPQILALQANKLQGSYPLEWGPDTAFPLLEELYLQSNLVRIALLCKPFRFHTLSPVAPHVLGLPAMLCCDTQRTCLSESACAMQLEGSLPRTGPGGAVQFPRTRIIDLSCALPAALPADPLIDLLACTPKDQLLMDACDVSPAVNALLLILLLLCPHGPVCMIRWHQPHADAVVLRAADNKFRGDLPAEWGEAGNAPAMELL